MNDNPNGILKKEKLDMGNSAMKLPFFAGLAGFPRCDEKVTYGLFGARLLLYLKGKKDLHTEES